ncbi:MAG TPA: elongation factor G [Candidatus Fimimorpha faecalis]|uniref:Elongation factor G n=1 Tax=Candidatus Fimimorpha faecalis TaxID=2840824 RepID=A0A9D1JEM3_9FIRM|nr:elongation factor G [Candidatus Fimimorpha faecalis]
MNIYETKQIRNVVVLGHGSAGKTTMIEAMAYVTGVTNRLARVDDGNTISDFDKEEIKRKFSIGTSVVPIEYEDIKVNFLDTPGYFDFVGEVEEALSAADAAIIVVNGKSGVQVGTEKAWDFCEKYNLPRMIFVTNMDDDQASFRQIAVELNEKFGRKIAPFHIPIRENEKFVGFVNVVKMKGRRFIGNTSEYEECEIPDYSEKHLTISREALIEAVAETNEEYMERYFEGEEFTYEEISTALREHVIDGQIVPVLMGSGINAQGMKMLLMAIKKYFPSPAQRPIYGNDTSNGEMVMLQYDCTKHTSAKVFKTLVDPFIGKYSMIKVVTGVLKAGDMIYNVNKEREDKAAKLYILRGKEAIEVSELHAGDIGALTKIEQLATGDTLASKGATVLYQAPDISTPYTYMRYKAKNKGDEDKIATALGKLMDEDLTLKTVNDSENRQTLIYGIGDQQLDVVVSKLLNRYKVEIELSKPKIAFRETIRKKVLVQGKHKKQSGGHGQYGDVQIEFEPSGDLEKAYVFEERVVGGAVPKNYFPAVEKGLQESVLKGPLAGYPVVGIKATLVDGSYHPVDSSEMAFKMATILAFKKGFMEASPVLLEPIATLQVTVPNNYAGDVMGDLNKRRGRVLGMDHIPGGKQVITADVPMSEIFGYSTDLRSMTGGIGDFKYEFARYEQAPGDIQKKEVEARAAKTED